MDRSERIRAMEARLSALLQAQKDLDTALEGYAAARKDLASLNAYYGSGDWHADRRADETGQLPPDLPRGVLSEDGIWNALEADRELLSRMAEIAAALPRESNPPEDTAPSL